MAEVLTFVQMWLGRREAAQWICLSFQLSQILRTFTISPITSTTGRILELTTTTILPFGHYVMKFKVYSCCLLGNLFRFSLKKNRLHKLRSKLNMEAGSIDSRNRGV